MGLIEVLVNLLVGLLAEPDTVLVAEVANGVVEFDHRFHVLRGPISERASCRVALRRLQLGGVVLNLIDLCRVLHESVRGCLVK